MGAAPCWCQGGGILQRRGKVVAKALERHLGRTDLSDMLWAVPGVCCTLPFRKPREDPHTPSAAWRRRLLLLGAVVWACLRFCSPELRFISLKHPLARHSAICSVRRKTHLAVCFRGTWQAPCGGCPSPTRLQSWWLSPPSPPAWRVALQGVPQELHRINSGRSECHGPLGRARNSRGRGLTAGPETGMPRLQAGPWLLAAPQLPAH